MQSSQDDNQNPASSTGTPSFSPFLANALETQGRLGFRFGSACYNQKYNMIIAYPQNAAIQFYDATTLKPVEGRRFKPLKENGSASCMSYYQETDIYLIGCESGAIYTYNASSQKLRKLRSLGQCVKAIAFVDSMHYSFSRYNSNNLSLGPLENEHVFEFGSHNRDPSHLERLDKSPILLVALEDGSIIGYRAKNLPQLRMVWAVQACRCLGAAYVQSAVINGKEYVITAKGYTVKVWYIIKGKMRLLKAIQMKEPVADLVYLENYKMIAVGDKMRHLSFFRVLSGKLEKTLTFNFELRKMFLMKDKDMIGLVSFYTNRIDIVQLHK